MVRVAPFTALIDPLRELFYMSRAAPEPGTAEDGVAALPELEEAFRSRHRTPRLEFIEELSPGLPALLEQRGWRLTERVPVLTCEPPQLRRPPAPDGLEIEALGPDSPDERIREFMAVQRSAFGDDEEPKDAELARWRRRAERAVHVAGSRDRRMVGTAVAVPPAGGVVEIVGVATLPEHRRQGIAGALTAEATARGFGNGATLAWLSAADDTAARIYMRAGYVRAGTQVGYNRN